MNASEYNQLDMDQKTRMLWTSGMLLDERIEFSKFRVCIYHLRGFYVELTIGMKDDSIRRVHAMEKPRDWNGYLNSVDLEALLG